MSVWWGWLLVGFAIGLAVGWLLVRELLVRELLTFEASRPRGITIDLVGANLADPDNWFDDPLRGIETEVEARWRR